MTSQTKEGQYGRGLRESADAPGPVRDARLNRERRNGALPGHGIAHAVPSRPQPPGMAYRNMTNPTGSTGSGLVSVAGRPSGHATDRAISRGLAWLVGHRAQILALFALAAIAAGGLLYLVGEGAAGEAVWAVAVGV